MADINYKNRVKVLLVSVILLMLVAIAAIFIIDPYQIFHRSFFWSGRAYGKTVFQNAGIINNYNFDSVIIGSSMLENIPAHEASNRIGGHFANLSISDSDFYERSIILRKVLQKKIKNVIFSMDEHVYLYPRFGHQNRHPSTYSFLYDDNPYNDYKVYLNRDFIRLIFNPPVNSVDLPNPWITDEKTAVRFGGWKNWIINPAPSWEKDFISQRLPLAAESSVGKTELGPAIKLKWSKLEYLRNYVLYIAGRNKRTKFHLIFPPYYRFVHANERQNDQNKFLQYQAAIRYVVSRTRIYRNVKVYGFDDMPFTADIANYTDLTHFKPEYNILMLDAIASKTHILRPKNVEDYLARTEKLAYDFDLVALNDEVQGLVKELEGGE